MTVLYQTDAHRAVLFRLHGTVWRAVLPFCVANMFLTYFVWWLQFKKGYSVTCKNTGHGYLSIMVAFLVVARSNIAYGRFWEARTRLGHMLGACRQLSMCVVALSGRDNSQKAKNWRQSIKRRLIRMLRTTTNVIQDERVNTLLTVGPWHEKQENSPEFLDPVDLATNLQAIIQANDEYLEKKFNFLECNKLLGFVSSFISSYYDITKFTTTPYPFPIVQMARTILFVWIFTLPLALVNDIHKPVYASVLMFFITYGFIGLEYVSIELHDPFGTDANDFETQKYTDVIVDEITYELDSDNSALFKADFEKGLDSDLGKIVMTDRMKSVGHQVHLASFVRMSMSNIVVDDNNVSEGE